MDSVIKGIPITLYVKGEPTFNDFGEEIFEETATTINNVIVSPLSSQEQTDAINLYGRSISYNLFIPKNDANSWTQGTRVEFFGKVFQTIGEPKEFIESLLPLEWNKQISVIAYE